MRGFLHHHVYLNIFHLTPCSWAPKMGSVMSANISPPWRGYFGLTTCQQIHLVLMTCIQKHIKTENEELLVEPRFSREHTDYRCGAKNQSDLPHRHLYMPVATPLPRPPAHPCFPSRHPNSYAILLAVTGKVGREVAFSRYTHHFKKMGCRSGTLKST